MIAFSAPTKHLFSLGLFLFISFSLFSPPSAKAGLILNHPNYLELGNGLVGFWSFDGKDMAGFPIGANPATAYDRSGNGNDGKYWNATGTQPVIGKIGEALNFNGSTQYVDMGEVYAVDGISKMTVSAW